MHALGVMPPLLTRLRRDVRRTLLPLYLGDSAGVGEAGLSSVTERPTL